MWVCFRHPFFALVMSQSELTTVMLGNSTVKLLAPDNGLVKYSSGRFVSGYQMVWYSTRGLKTGLFFFVKNVWYSNSRPCNMTTIWVSKVQPWNTLSTQSLVFLSYQGGSIIFHKGNFLKLNPALKNLLSLRELYFQTLLYFTLQSSTILRITFSLLL